MAEAQFQLNPRPGWAFVIKLKSDPLKVIGLSKFMCNTEYFLRKEEMEKWEVGNWPMFFLLSPYEDLEVSVTNFSKAEMHLLWPKTIRF